MHLAERLHVELAERAAHRHPHQQRQRHDHHVEAVVERARWRPTR